MAVQKKGKGGGKAAPSWKQKPGKKPNHSKPSGNKGGGKNTRSSWNNGAGSSTMWSEEGIETDHFEKKTGKASFLPEIQITDELLADFGEWTRVPWHELKAEMTQKQQGLFDAVAGAKKKKQGRSLHEHLDDLETG
ncbi:unnamed protein product, partial [Amoebophrya sp. A25]|eukprot:GSA25T00011178001.1